MFRSFISAVIGLACLTVLAPANGFDFTPNPDFLTVHEAFKVSAIGTPDSVQVRIVTAPGYYLYKSKLSFRTLGNDVLAEAAVLPAGEHKEDPYFGHVVVYHDTLEARVPIQNHGSNGFEMRVGFQGCAEKGLCYPPDEQIIHINSEAGVTAASGWSAMSVVAAFISGLKLFLTPGVLPAVPLLATLLLLGKPSVRRGLTIGLAFTAPMATGFVVLNTVIALTDAGIGIQPLAQSVWILVPAVLILLILAGMEGGLANPGRDDQQPQTSTLRSFSTGTAGAVLLGLVSLTYTTPFTSSAMAAVMLYLKAGGEPLGGIAQLVGLALGMISPLVLIALTIGVLLPEGGKWTRVIAAFMRVLLAIVAVWVLGRVLPGPVTLGLYGLVTVWSAVRLGVFGVLKSPGSLTTKAPAVALMLYGVVAWAGMLKGESSPLHPLGPNMLQMAGSSEQPWMIVTTPQQLATALKEAKIAGTPALVEWTADWAPWSTQVAAAARTAKLVRDSLRTFKAIRVDLSHGGESTNSMLELNGLFGPTAVQLYRADGVEVQSARLVGVTTDNEILASMEAVEIHADK